MASTQDIAELPVRHDKEAQRFVVGHDGDNPLAFVEYDVVGGSCGSGAVMDLFHTFTDPRGRGKGLAGKVVGAAFQYAQSSGNKILPTCSYVRDGFLPRHEEYRGLCVTDGRQPPVRAVLPAENEAGTMRDDNHAEPSSPESDADAAETGASDRQEAHLFRLAYDQYARQLYEPAAAATAQGTAVEVPHLPVRPDVPARSLVRFASLLSRRAREVSSAEAADSSPSALRSEAAWIMGVAQSRFPESAWRIERADDTLDDLGRHGERSRVEEAKAMDDARGDEESPAGPPAGVKRARKA